MPRGDFVSFSLESMGLAKTGELSKDWNESLEGGLLSTKLIAFGIDVLPRFMVLTLEVEGITDLRSPL